MLFNKIRAYTHGGKMKRKLALLLVVVVLAVLTAVTMSSCAAFGGSGGSGTGNRGTLVEDHGYAVALEISSPAESKSSAMFVDEFDISQVKAKVRFAKEIYDEELDEYKYVSGILPTIILSEINNWVWVSTTLLDVGKITLTDELTIKYILWLVWLIPAELNDELNLQYIVPIGSIFMFMLGPLPVKIGIPLNVPIGILIPAEPVCAKAVWAFCDSSNASIFIAAEFELIATTFPLSSLIIVTSVSYIDESLITSQTTFSTAL